MSNSLRLGSFIVATLVIFSAGVFWIGSSQFRFTSTYRLNAEFENVAGLQEGAAVRIGGVHEGSVHRIFLPSRPDKKVRVEMDLKGNTHAVIKKDSVAAIKTEGLVGDQYVEVTFGSVDAAPVKNGDSIDAEQPLQISDMMKKANTILDSAQGAMSNVQQIASNLQAVSTKLNNGQGTMGALMNDKGVYQHMNNAAANLQEDTEALKHSFLLKGFFKNRGYEDTTELKRDAIAELPAATPANRFSWPGARLFEKKDSAKLKNGKLLDQAGKALEAQPFGMAVVADFADPKGDTDKQRQLSEARAAVVREYLVQHFKLDDTKVKVIGLGKSPNAPDGGVVELRVYGVNASQGNASREKPAGK